MAANLFAKHSFLFFLFSHVLISKFVKILFLNEVEFFFKADLISLKYGKKPFLYNALDAYYDFNIDELCIKNGIQLEIKRFWIQPENNQFCILQGGDFPIFENSTLIKKRWLKKEFLLQFTCLNLVLFDI